MFHYHKKKMYHRNKGFGMTRHNKGNCTPNERIFLTKVCDDDCYFHLLPTCWGLGWAEDPLEEMRRDGVVDPELSAESLLNLSKKLGVSVLTDPVGVGPRDLKYYLISTTRLCWLGCTCLLVEDSTPSHLFSNLPSKVWGRSALADWESTGGGLSRRPRPSQTGLSKNWTVASAPEWKEI